MGITSSAMLVELNLSVWTASKLDKAETSKVTTNNSAVKGAAQVRKNLMAGTSYRKDIADYAAGCRLWHNSQTLPWAEKGARLIPTSLFMDYKSEANVRKATFNKMVNEFITVYPSLVQTAQNYLVGLFDLTDYPDAEVVPSSDTDRCSHQCQSRGTSDYRWLTKTYKNYVSSTRSHSIAGSLMLCVSRGIGYIKLLRLYQAS